MSEEQKIQRVNRILKLLKEYWLHYPELRLCQMIMNLTNEIDSYYFEDYEIERILKEKLRDL